MTKPKKSYKNAVKGASREFREKALEEATPWWDEDTPVTVAPIQAITSKRDLGCQEKTILFAMLGCAPTFEWGMTKIREQLGRDGKLAATKTAAKYLTSLEEKGYIKRFRVNWDDGGYYSYVLKDLKLGVQNDRNGKNSPHSIESKDSNTLDLCSSEAETTPAGEADESRDQCWEPEKPAVSAPRATKAEVRAMSLAVRSVQPVGKPYKGVTGMKVNSRRVAGWTNRMKRELMFETGEKSREEEKRRLQEPKPHDPPLKSKGGPVEPSKSRLWKVGKCTKAKAMAWLEHCPEGKAMSERLLEMSNQPEWTPELARRLFYRWRAGLLEVKSVLQLERLIGKDYEKYNLLYLIAQGPELLKTNRAMVNSEREILAERIREFRTGDQIQVDAHVQVATDLIKLLHTQKEVTYERIWDIIPSSVPRYSLIVALHRCGYDDLVHAYHMKRGTTLEAEMAANHAVWQLCYKGYGYDPNLFFYDKDVYEDLREQEKMMLEQECAVYGMTLDSAMERFDEE